MRITLVVLLAYAVIQANAQQPDDPANATTTATTPTTAPTTTTSAGSSSSVGSKGTATASSTTGSTAPTTTTPLPMTSYALKNDKTVVDGKLLLQRSVALSSEVQSLIDEINFLEASVNATNSPYFDQMAQMQDTATQMNATLSVLLEQLKVQNDRYTTLSAMATNITEIYTCFSKSGCVTPTPTTTPFISTTTPPLDKCPDGPDKDDVTTDPKVYTVTNVSNVRCWHVFNADDGFNVVFQANVTIAGAGAALNIINAQTGNILKSITATSSVKVDTMVSNAQLVYSANWLSAIELHITYYSVSKSNPCEENPLICNNGTCTINPNTGGVLCICPACDSGDHCESEQNPCDGATAKRKCRVGQSEAPGTCLVDDSITEYCAYKCNCTYPIEGVTNQCGTAPSPLQQYARWWQPPQEVLQKMWQKLW